MINFLQTTPAIHNGYGPKLVIDCCAYEQCLGLPELSVKVDLVSFAHLGFQSAKLPHDKVCRTGLVVP